MAPRPITPAGLQTQGAHGRSIFVAVRNAIGLSLQQASATAPPINTASPAAEFASHGGAFPLTVKGAGVIGVVTVSGLPQRQDHEFVVEALCAVLGHDASALAFASDKA